MQERDNVRQIARLSEGERKRGKCKRDKVRQRERGGERGGSKRGSDLFLTN